MSPIQRAGRFTLPVAALAAWIAAATIYTRSAFGFDPERDSLSPDITASLRCRDNAAPSDDFWERWLAEIGFRPLNPPALARKNGVPWDIYGQRIYGIDSKERFMGILSSRSSDGYGENVFISLNSPPPTVHDVILEQAIRDISQRSKCEVMSIETHENIRQRLAMFRSILARIKVWYAEAEALEHH